LQSRIQYEREAFEMLVEEGFECGRSAGSRGPCDLLAWDRDHVLFIQVKSTRNALNPSSLSMCAKAIRLLQAMPVPPGGSRWLFLRELKGRGIKGGWLRLQVDGWEAGRGQLRNRLRQEVMLWMPRKREPDIKGV